MVASLITGTIAAKKYKMTTETPKSIMAPDKVKTSIGTLKYFDGVPDEATVDKVYDYLDRSRATEAFLNCIPVMSMYGIREGQRAFGIDASNKIVVYDKAFAHEGKGLYFAQSGSNTKNGGAYQIVQAAPGQTYRLTGYVFTYTHGEAKKPMDNNCRIGIDPTGGRGPDSPDVVWTPKTESEEHWTPIRVEAIARQPRITVFVRHEMRRGNYWNLTMFDQVRLEAVK